MATAKSEDCSMCREASDGLTRLPCAHAYCPTCLLKDGDQRRPGDEFACPLCRQTHTVPMGGLETWRIKVLDGRVPEDKRLSRSNYVSSMLAFVSPTNCSEHKQELLLYCVQCCRAVCALCAATEHAAHECADLATTARDFSARLRARCVSLESDARTRSAQLDALRDHKGALLALMATCERDVSDRSIELKRLADDTCSQRLDQLDSLKTVKIKEAKRLQDVIEEQLAKVESLRTHMKGLADKGSDCTILQNAVSLLNRAEELDAELANNSSTPNEDRITFTPTNLQDPFGAARKWFGFISVNGEQSLQ